MFRSKLWVLAWFPFTGLLLLVNLLTLLHYEKVSVSSARLNAMAPEQSNFGLTASSGTSQILNATVIAGDARVLLLKEFMARQQSPMTEYADVIVNESDKNGLPFQLIPAIAMCESNLGKHIPSHDSYNPFGVAVYTGQLSGKKFGSWSDAIVWFAKYLRVRYFDQGITDLRDIGARYAPPSVATGYSWSNCVQTFQNKII